ncbi:hypothetical protein L873DRAFT_678400 [Choiromyces venosus 120613-1]|uniref:Secreted protein n=1 Tax=Choiromyces venosus 120613-1 TaxID=1336337 RepID=A0A3N4JX08_9PEZI|nr:hypothetical protein L873DRAFT_678400 [Choiromyces venosus 120613-1]
MPLSPGLVRLIILVLTYRSIIFPNSLLGCPLSAEQSIVCLSINPHSICPPRVTNLHLGSPGGHGLNGSYHIVSIPHSRYCDSTFILNEQKHSLFTDHVITHHQATFGSSQPST